MPPCADEPCRARAEAELARLRREFIPDGPRAWKLAASIREERTGHELSARGACALRPPDALRLQLVGPAGALALDLWARGDKARLAIPALDRVEREPEALGPGRPTRFLRWWLLAPLEGEVAGVWSDGEATRWRLRTAEGGQIEATQRGDVLLLERSDRGDQERIEARGGACGVAIYTSEAARLRVEVRCEGPGPEPSPRAFDDPG